MKNLVFVGKVLHHCGVAGVLRPKEREMGDSNRDGEGEGERVRDLQWLVEKMLRLARFEAAQHPKESLKVQQCHKQVTLIVRGIVILLTSFISCFSSLSLPSS